MCQLIVSDLISSFERTRTDKDLNDKAHQQSNFVRTANERLYSLPYK